MGQLPRDRSSDAGNIFFPSRDLKLDRYLPELYDSSIAGAPRPVRDRRRNS